MKVHFLCPRCEATAGVEAGPDTTVLDCPHCRRSIETPPDAFRDGALTRCLVCPSDDLFIRKDFPQKLGLSIIVGGFALSSVAWYFHRIFLAYGILFATALIDAALYLWMGNVVTCYHCHSEYRGLGEGDRYEGFDLEVHERYRQQKARLAQAEAESQRAAAGAPDREDAPSPGAASSSEASSSHVAS